MYSALLVCLMSQSPEPGRLCPCACGWAGWVVCCRWLKNFHYYKFQYPVSKVRRRAGFRVRAGLGGFALYINHETRDGDGGSGRNKYRGRYPVLPGRLPGNRNRQFRYNRGGEAPGTALGVLLRLLARAAPLQVPLFSDCCMLILSFLFLGQVRPSLVAKLEVKPDPNEQQAMRKTASQEHSPPCALNDKPQRTSHSSTMRPTDDPLAELETGAASGRPCGD